VAPIRFTLEYAAPEIAHAWEAGGTAINADRAVDIWSIGVAAYELLTQRRAFSTKLLEAEIWDQIAGRAGLPWELLTTDAPNHFKARIKGIVLTCLHRDPAQRPTAGALVKALREVLAMQPGSVGWPS
jgi:serine/threonine protein kinase